MVKGSQKAECGLFGLVKRTSRDKTIFVDWSSDLMPVASNLLTSTAFATQLAQLIQARLGEGRCGFALFPRRPRGAGGGGSAMGDGSA
jgi:hypothetical protein